MTSDCHYADWVAERRNGSDVIEGDGIFWLYYRLTLGIDAQFTVIVSTPAINLSIARLRFDDGACMSRSRNDLGDFRAHTQQAKFASAIGICRAGSSDAATDT
jgi:hypothetical protein